MPGLDRRGGTLRTPGGLAGASGAVAGACALGWLVLAPRTPDLAAQVYRAGFFAQHGLSVWDDQWFAGHHVPGYSLIFPPLGALLGARVTGALAAVAAAMAFGWLAAERLGRRAPPAAAWFALGTLGELLIGRLTFALGTAIGLGALIALSRGRRAAAGALAVLCSLTSPVAGLFLLMAAGAVALAGPSSARRGALITGAGALGATVALSITFPEGGSEPFSPVAATLAIAIAIGVAVAVEPGRTVLRAGAGLYALGTLAALTVSSPMGSNATRPAALLAGPLLVGAGRLRRGWLLAGLALPLAVYEVWGPTREVGKADASTHAGYYAPVLRFLATQPAQPVRIEVPFTRAHWETALLARSVALARGWEGQLDVRYDGLFHDGALRPEAYRRWLDGLGVHWVALPDVALAPAGRDEARLIRAGLPWLALAQRTAHWSIYAVVGAPGLLSGPGRLTSLGATGFSLDAAAAGTLDVRVRFTPYWALVAGSGCVGPGPSGFTRVRVTGPGPVRVAARFALGRIGATTPRCRGR